jgi:hypothetical protein
MVVGELRSKIDAVWNSFCSGRIAKLRSASSRGRDALNIDETMVSGQQKLTRTEINTVDPIVNCLASGDSDVPAY